MRYEGCASGALDDAALGRDLIEPRHLVPQNLVPHKFLPSSIHVLPSIQLARS